MSLPTSLAEVIEAAQRTAAAHMYTSLPAKVVSYNPATNTVDAEIQVKAPYFNLEGEREFDELPIVPSVPVIWPRGGGFVVTVPLAPGDFVWLMFSTLSLAEWRTTGQVSEPTDARRHSIGYPYALPGAFPDVSPLSPVDTLTRTSKMIVGEDGGQAQIVIDSNPLLPSIKVGGNAIDLVALSTPTNAGLAACMAAANAAIAAAAGIIASLADHTHSGVQTGGGVTGSPIFVAAPPAAPSAGVTPPTVAATMVKAQ